MVMSVPPELPGARFDRGSAAGMAAGHVDATRHGPKYNPAATFRPLSLSGGVEQLNQDESHGP